MKYPPVTVCALIYKSPEWLAWWLEGMAFAKNRTLMRLMVVGNDAEPAVVETGRLDVDHRNEPGLTRMGKIYAAWNRCVKEAETDFVVLCNSDMYPFDGWLDALIDVRMNCPKSVPCSLLMESGRLQSAMPEFVNNFGLTPETFDVEAFRLKAAQVAVPGVVEPGRLYQPCLLNRSEFFDVGMYPLGNPEGTTGDKDLFRRYEEAGFVHLTAKGSVMAHIQVGEAGGYYPDV